MKSTVSWVFKDLKFKISEGYDQNWCFPDSAQLAVSAKLRQLTGQSQENTNFGPNFFVFQGRESWKNIAKCELCSSVRSNLIKSFKRP